MDSSLSSSSSFAGIVLAAGQGRRLRPLTEIRPKPLCPVQLRPLIEWAFERLTPHVGTGPGCLAVNTHHLPEQILAHIGQSAHVAVETELLGTAGAVGNLLGWIDGRDVLLTNSDSFFAPNRDALAGLVAGSRERLRLLVTRPDDHEQADFDDPGDDSRGWRYVGGCMLPFHLVKGLRAEPSGLYEAMWRDLDRSGEIDFVEFPGTAIDCGTPADYLRANLAGGAQNIVDPTAEVLGDLDECVVWDRAYVGPEESLSRCIRVGGRGGTITVSVGIRE